jgi:chemotaxis protein MotB
VGRKKHDHEDHVNHEAWAIPYGDLVTLLLAFFVVMYAVSSVNEGKYRVLSDSLVAAFRGQPHTMEPISIGTKVAKVKPDDSLAAVRPKQALKFDGGGPEDGRAAGDGEGDAGVGGQLREVADDLAQAMQELIDRDLIRIQRTEAWIEVEIKTDILFASGSAEIGAEAIGILERVAAILQQRPYPVRVEGHTDNRPIRTLQFPSNWELSAARAARIVRLFEERGIAPARLVVAGMGDQEPVDDNATDAGRNRNRRVVLVILGTVPTADAKPVAEGAPDPATVEAVEATAAPAAAVPAAAPVPAAVLPPAPAGLAPPIVLPPPVPPITAAVTPARTTAGATPTPGATP